MWEVLALGDWRGLFWYRVHKRVFQALKDGQWVLVCVDVLPPRVVVHQLIDKSVVELNPSNYFLLSETRVLGTRRVLSIQWHIQIRGLCPGVITTRK